MEELQSYSDVLKHLNEQNRKHHLLLGNGFSMAYDGSIFSYNALNDLISESDDAELKLIFEILKTQNFEIVMKQLDNYAEISNILGADQKLIDKVKMISLDLKTKLLNSITSLHPEQVFNISEAKSKSCAEFIKEYLQSDGNVFSSNYDLLLYWILMRNSDIKCNDGFGRYPENIDDSEFIPEGDITWSGLTWGKYKTTQNIYYLHGALPLFDTGSDIIKEEYNGNEYLLNSIKKRIEKGEYPIFVTAGDGDQKLYHIRHNQYLNYCYDTLCQIDGSLVVFGFGFGEFEKHIIKAINKAAHLRNESGNKLLSIYIGIFSQKDYNHIKSIESEFRCKVNLYDAKTANIWAEQ
jgi:hypothetical protein